MMVVAPLTASAAEISTDESVNKIYFDAESSGWDNYEYIFCHIWAADGSGTWRDWDTRAERCVLEKDGRWSYDLANTGNDISPDDGNIYCVIFASSAGSQTYNMIMSGSCIGDEVYVTGNLLENPEDSEKVCVEAAWRNNPDCGSEKKITSTGNIIGTAFPEGESDETLLATYLLAYYDDEIKMDTVPELVEELEVNEDHVLEAVSAKLDNYVEAGSLTDEEANEAYSAILEVLELCNEDDADIDYIEVDEMPDQITYYTDCDEYLSYDGLCLTIYYSDGDFDYYCYYEENCEDDDISFSINSFDELALGDNEVTVTYMGYSTTFNVTLIENPVESIEITKLPNKLEYIEDYETYVDIDGIELDINYKDGTTGKYALNLEDFDWDSEDDPYTYNGIEITGQMDDDMSVGEHTAIIDYLGCTDEFTYYIVENPVESIEITKLPDKVFEYEFDDPAIYDDEDSYFENALSFNMAGAELTVYYTDGTEDVFTFGDYSLSYIGAVYEWEEKEEVVYATEAYDYLGTVYFMGRSTFFEAKSKDNTDPVQPFTVGDYTYRVLDDESVAVIYYDGDETDVTVPEAVNGYKVTEIGVSAFSYCENIESIVIPDSVTAIGKCAFMNCSALESIVIPDSVATIGDYAFALCESLTSITLPEGLTEIGDGTFSNCISLEEIEIPDSVVHIGAYALDDTAWYENQTEDLIYAGKVAYRFDCYVEYPYGGNDPVIKDGTKGIADYAFAYEYSISKVVLPDSLECIGDYAYIDCCNMTSIKIPENVTYIGEYAIGYTEVYDESLSEDSDVTMEPIEDFIIFGYAGSAAETYANENGFEFIEIGSDNDFSDGDVNHDGVVDINDATYLQMYLAGYPDAVIDESDAYEFALADFNGDNIIDVNDATAIQMYLAGI